MKHRLDIHDNAIIAAVRENFDLALQSIEFLPIGEGAWVYKGTDDGRHEWFIKLCRTDTANVSRVTAYLHAVLGLSFVLSPLIAKNQAQSPKLQEYYINVYPFVQGETLSYDALTKEYLAEIAHDLRRMHDGTLPVDIQAVLPRETFDKFQASASELVTRARDYSGGDELLQHLRDFVEAKWSFIDQILRNAHRLSDYCKRHTYEFVVCHADIHPFNILKADREGYL
jgi:spectinomycin phosphotransferase